MKILVVDDSNTMRRILANILKQMGDHQVVEAADGLEGLAQMVNEPDIGLVLTDWNMPNLNGYDFLVKLRETNKTIPVVMVTTEAEKANVLAAIKAGANNYIVKPFTPETVKEKLAQFIK
ncbi:MAG: response regulator [Planctomycetota bacterium]|nr:response regulator [Planctomycetota bacterium]